MAWPASPHGPAARQGRPAHSAVRVPSVPCVLQAVRANTTTPVNNHENQHSTPPLSRPPRGIRALSELCQASGLVSQSQASAPTKPSVGGGGSRSPRSLHRNGIPETTPAASRGTPRPRGHGRPGQPRSVSRQRAGAAEDAVALTISARDMRDRHRRGPAAELPRRAAI